MRNAYIVPAKRGFTLIELMVVGAIIGILMAAGIVTFSNAQKVARDAKRRADVDAIAKATEQYYQNYQTYFAVETSSLGTSWQSGSLAGYLGAFFPAGKPPLDPINSSPYMYVISSIPANHLSNPIFTEARFCVLARLETRTGNCTGYRPFNASDPDSYRCIYTTPDTSTNVYCVSNRQ